MIPLELCHRGPPRNYMRCQIRACREHWKCTWNWLNFQLAIAWEIHCFGSAQKAHDTAALLKLSRQDFVTDLDETLPGNLTFATLSSIVEQWKIQVKLVAFLPQISQLFV